MLIGVLLLIIIGLVLRIFLYNRDVLFIADDLKFNRKKNLRSSKLIRQTGNKSLLRLIEEINLLIDDKQKISLESQANEKHIKEIVGSISHDLRTPLTSIKGYTELLYDRAKSEEEKKYLKIIHSRAEMMNNLINSFYELSKLELKELEYDLEYVDIKALLTNVIAANYENFLGKNIIPKVTIEDGNFEVLGDFQSIERVFNNLVDNAIKYGKDSIEIRLCREAGRIKTEFINGAEGLNEKDVENLFKRFFVMDSSRQSNSTGLGLFITKELVEHMGYEIEAKLLNKKINISIVWSDD